jgi:hypothetical protein
MTTATRVHVFVTFANPYLVCGQPVPRWHSPDACGCTGPVWNEPCRHRTYATTRCWSWSPVDGCTCAAVLGEVPHGAPSRDLEQTT